MDEISTAMTTAFSGVSDNVVTIIGNVLPYSLAVVGTVLAIKIAIRVFKSITG